MGKKVTDEKKDRKFGGTLYPDSSSYNCDEVIAIIKDYFNEYAFCLHDKDVEEDGSLKKPHIHWVAKKTNGSYPSTVAKVLGLPQNDIEKLRLWKNSVQYLIHFNDEDKYQYDIKNIYGNIKEINKYFEEVSEGEVVQDFVDKKLSGYTYYDLLREAVKEGYYAEFRRNIGVIDMIVKELEFINNTGKKAE